MTVDPSTAKYRTEHGGQTYYFCCASCLEKFKSDPSRYLTTSRASLPETRSGMQVISIAPASAPGIAPAKPALVPLAPSSAVPSSSAGKNAYVCPMCPEVRAAEPSACPKCGMALEPEMPVASSRVEYTCPMHPEIVRPGPGNCPICGMALEPRTITGQEEENPELREMTRRFWISLALTVPLLAIAMGGHAAGGGNVARLG